LQQRSAAPAAAPACLQRADDAVHAEHADAAAIRFIEQLVDERPGDDAAASAADAARGQRAEEVAVDRCA
jgi:hypothetical protein